MRIDLDALYPRFLETLLMVLDACSKRGQDYYPLYGYRSWAQQHQLRLAYLAGQGGRAAPAGYSSHQYGLAVDLAADGDRNKAGLQPDWKDSSYEILGQEAQKAGLHWGAAYNDRLHVSWPGLITGDELEVLRRIWRACPAGATETRRLAACWQYIDSLHEVRT